MPKRKHPISAFLETGPPEPPQNGTAHEPKHKRFLLVREEDVSGTSGTGVVAEGIQFTNGTAVMTWLSPLQSVSLFQSIDVLKAIHGHDGRTHVVFVDKEEE